MKISELRKAVRELFQEKRIYAAEAIVNALVEASKDDPYLDEEFLRFLIHDAFKRLEYENEEE